MGTEVSQLKQLLLITYLSGGGGDISMSSEVAGVTALPLDILEACNLCLNPEPRHQVVRKASEEEKETCNG